MVTCTIRLSKVANYGEPSLAPVQHIGGFILNKGHGSIGMRILTALDP